MAGIAFPTWAYNLTQPPQIVASQAALTALGPGWQTFPFTTALINPPIDPGFTVTDTRLQQSLIEQRITNLLLLVLAGNGPDTVDLQGLRNDVLTADSSLQT